MTWNLQFEAFLESAPDAMLVVGRTGTILLVNTHAEQLFGYERHELIGRPVEILVPRRFTAMHPQHRDKYVNDPHRRPMGAGVDLFGLRRDGSEFPVEISLSPLESSEGTLVISAVRDITERKRLEDDVRRQSRMKSEFLANMSHELRTPLNSIIGFTELMHDGRVGATPPAHKEYLNDILTSARHLLRLINDVLDLSKVESGRMEFFPELVDVSELAGQLRDLMRAQARAKHIEVHVDVPPTLGRFWLDRAKLKQVLYNYVSNAVKFTAEGGRVEIGALRQADGGLRVEVRDTGIGIREEDLDRLFVEFLQLDAGSSKLHAGTGLGLALTKRIVEAQGGSVGVESTFGRGSVFYVVLPRAADDGAVAAPLPPTR